MKRTKDSMAPRGGMVDAPAFTPPGYARRLLNCYYRTGSWVWRGGIHLAHSVKYSESFVWAGANKTAGPAAAAWVLLGGTGGNPVSGVAAHFTKGIGGTMVAIPYNSVLAPDTANEAWRAWEDAPVSDTVRYLCRRTKIGTGLLYHHTENQVTAAGIPEPPANPAVIDSSGAGVLPAGTYPVAYRYKTADGEYSPWTEPVIATIALNKKRSWTLVKSEHPRVTAIQLGVGFASGDLRNVYLAVDDVPNVSGVYEEDTLPAAYDIEVPADFDLTVPPTAPEDAGKWDNHLWLVSNTPDPLLWHSDTSASGAETYELFNPLAAQKLPIGGGQRYQAFKPWDRTRAVAMTDAAALLIEPTAGGQYTVEVLDEHHGCVSASACDVGGGYLAWFDGRNVIASRGNKGDAKIVSRGFADKVLSQVPEAYADKAFMRYVPNDGGSFWLSIPSTPTSTSVDLVLCWRPAEDEWHTRSYFKDNPTAPVFVGQILAPFAGNTLTLACFDEMTSVVRIDSPVLRDAGITDDAPNNIQVLIETAAIQTGDKYGTAAVARQHIGVRRRVDSTLPDQGFKVSCLVSLNVNGTETTPVTAAQVDGAEYISALAENLDAPASDVSIVMRFDHPDALEVFDVIPEAVLYQREMART